MQGCIEMEYDDTDGKMLRANHDQDAVHALCSGDHLDGLQQRLKTTNSSSGSWRRSPSAIRNPYTCAGETRSLAEL